jgi:hypothetical protein
MTERHALQPTNHGRRRVFRLVGIAFVLAISFALASLAGAATATIAVAPSSTSPPTISGTAQQGQTLTADKGAWSGT